MSRGRFISFEGGEGCGKSTQVKLLATALGEHGIPVLTSREPGGTPLGEAVRRLLLAPNEAPLAAPTELMLFAASRAQLVADVIAPALNNGQWVVMDRFADSTTVYQACAQGLDRSLVEAVNALAVQGCRPDRTLVLDFPAAVGLERAHAQQEFAEVGGDRFEREALAFHEAVHAGYHALAQAEPERVRLIDGTGSIEDVHTACWAAIADWITPV